MSEKGQTCRPVSDPALALFPNFLQVSSGSFLLVTTSSLDVEKGLQLLDKRPLLVTDVRSVMLL